MHLANSFASSSFGDSHSKFLILQVASWKIVYNRYWQPYFCTLVVLMKMCIPRLQTVRMSSWCARPRYFVFNPKCNSEVWKCAAENVVAVWILSCRSTVSPFPDISFTSFFHIIKFCWVFIEWFCSSQTILNRLSETWSNHPTRALPTKTSLNGLS